MEGYKIILGYVPTRRDMFPPDPAREVAVGVKARVQKIVEQLGEIELVDIQEVVPEGLLWCKDDIQPVIDFLISKKVDALFFPHCNFGQEEAVAKVAKAVNRPVLLWGPRDPKPDGESYRPLDIQCGMFATSKALASYKVPFTYLENCWLDSPVLDKGLDAFIRVASVVKSMRSMRVGQIGIRPRQFLSMKISESELLQKFGIEVTSIWTEEIVTVVRKLMNGHSDKIGNPTGVERRYGDLQDGGEPDPRIAERVAELKAALDCSQMADDKLTAMAAVEIAVEEMARIQKLDAVAMECWSFTSSQYGIPSCFLLGDLIDRGLVAACETDVHAAITARMLQAAARGTSAPFIADLTIRHPENENAELLWHCGPFAKSLIKEGVKGAIKAGGKGFYELKGGDVTVARMDQIDGKYQLFADHAVGCDGPVTNGNYLWVETNDWKQWEKKFMYGPYVHHMSCIHGDYTPVLKEACKYINELEHDSVNEIADLFDSVC